MSNDELFEAAIFYAENIKDKKFKLTAGRKGTKIELTIYFGEEHFKHLIGLHKLKDLPLYRRNSAIIFKEILEEKLTINDVQKSRFFYEIDERLKIFTKIIDALTSKDLMLKSLYGKFLGVEADYLLYYKDDINYIHLFMKDSNELVVPVTFFVREDDKYIKNNIVWKVLSIEEIKKPLNYKNNKHENKNTNTQK